MPVCGGFSPQLDVQDPLPDCSLESAVRHDAFLIAREAIHNAARHSGATELFIRIRKEGEGVEISIADNGKGFDPEEAAGGNGLRNMRARAAALGTKLEFHSVVGEGTSVSFSVPLPSGKNHPLG